MTLTIGILVMLAGALLCGLDAVGVRSPRVKLFPLGVAVAIVGSLLQ